MQNNHGCQAYQSRTIYKSITAMTVRGGHVHTIIPSQGQVHHMVVKAPSVRIMTSEESIVAYCRVSTYDY